MDIKDVEVGTLVQLDDNSSESGCIGVVESIDHLDKLVMLRLEGVITDSQYNTSTVRNRWNVGPHRFNEYQDPEADMVVWDALEVGEHFLAKAGYEAVKINATQYVLLGGGGMVFTVLEGKLGRHLKFKLV